MLLNRAQLKGLISLIEHGDPDNVYLLNYDGQIHATLTKKGKAYRYEVDAYYSFRSLD